MQVLEIVDKERLTLADKIYYSAFSVVAMKMIR